VKKELDHFILVEPTLDTHIQAAEMFDACRKRGYTIRSIIDCLIASLALEYDLTLLEKDKDYAFISKAFPLKTFRDCLISRFRASEALVRDQNSGCEPRHTQRVW
jgi:hypothetical protein